MGKRRRKTRVTKSRLLQFCIRVIARELVFSRPITKQSKGKTKAKYEIPYCSISRKTSAVIGQSRSFGKISFPGYLVVFMWMVLVVVNFCEEEPNPINTDRNEHILFSG